MRKTGDAATAGGSADGVRARKKWVSHGLSNRVVYGGLHYGAHWLPMPVLNAINRVGNTLALALLRETRRGIAENYLIALGVSAGEAARLTRALFFEYGRGTIDAWRLRSQAFHPRITTFDEDALRLAAVRRGGRGFLLVTGHVGNWEMGAVTLRGHGLTPAVVGQPELDPDVQQMRLELRHRLGVESIDIGSSMATAFRVRAAVDAGRAVALLVDRAYPEDQVIVSFFGRPTPFLRSPALLARFCGCDVLPGFFLRGTDGSYFNVWGEALSPDPRVSPEEDARRMMGRVAADLEAVVRKYPTQWFNFYRFWKEPDRSEDSVASAASRAASRG
jgi:KDO2-lipid IV(A) lauroyltransferase